MIASKKELAVTLSKLRTFSTPKPSLEQYPTDSEVAATVLWTAYMNGHIEDKNIADLGAGTGILGIGALLLGARHVDFIEIDPDIIPVLRENLKTATGSYAIITGNMAAYTKQVDVVLQNPPFGTRNEGADVQFLQHAMSLAPIIYSLHKTATQEYLERRVGKAGYIVKDILTFDFPLKQTLRQHKRRIQRIQVSCLLLERQE